jgi:hypothetical protein
MLHCSLHLQVWLPHSLGTIRTIKISNESFLLRDFKGSFKENFNEAFKVYKILCFEFGHY